MKNLNPLYLQENYYTDFLMKNKWYRDTLFKASRKFEKSKYAFPLFMHAYGWGTMWGPSGSVYAIALGSVPQKLRNSIIHQLEHAKSVKDIMKVKDILQEYGGDIILKRSIDVATNPKTSWLVNVINALPRV